MPPFGSQKNPRLHRTPKHPKNPLREARTPSHAASQRSGQHLQRTQPQPRNFGERRHHNQRVPHQGAAWKSAHYSAKQKQPQNHSPNPSPKNTRTTKPCSLCCFRNTSPPLTANSAIFPVRTNQWTWRHPKHQHPKSKAKGQKPFSNTPTATFGFQDRKTAHALKPPPSAEFLMPQRHVPGTSH